MADLIDSMTSEDLVAVRTALENAKTTIDGLNSTVETQGATIADLKAQLTAAQGRTSDPNLVADWAGVETALAALQPKLVAPSPAPQPAVAGS